MTETIGTHRGHTLIELLALLGIVAALSVAAAPSFTRLFLDSRMNAAAATTLHAVSVARQLAATRGEEVTLCGAGAGGGCSGDEDWSSGLLVAVREEEPHRRLSYPRSPGSLRVRSNRDRVRFEQGTGFATPATLMLCDRRGDAAARAVVVSRSGRPRVSPGGTASGASAC